MGRELMGNCIGIVGLGGAGSETAKRAHAFGMGVLAVDPTPARVPDYVSCWGIDRFYDLLAAADPLEVTSAEGDVELARLVLGSAEESESLLSQEPDPVDVAALSARLALASAELGSGPTRSTWRRGPIL